jgi:hypothetical protein
MTPQKQLPLCIGLLLWLNGPAQKTFEFSADTAIINTASCQMPEDKDGNVTFGQASPFALADKFHYDTTKKMNFHIATHWFCFMPIQS